MAKDHSNPAEGLPTPAIDTHRLQSALLKFGVSYVGAHQFLKGLPISDVKDRAAVIRLFSRLLQEGGPAPRGPFGSEKGCSRCRSCRTCHSCRIKCGARQ
jgi:hypothetical protein